MLFGRSGPGDEGSLWVARLDGSDSPAGIELGPTHRPTISHLQVRRSPTGTLVAWMDLGPEGRRILVAPLTGADGEQPWEVGTPPGELQSWPVDFLTDELLLLAACEEGCRNIESLWTVRIGLEGPEDVVRVTEFGESGADWIGRSPTGIQLLQTHEAIGNRIAPSDLLAVPVSLEDGRPTGPARRLGLGVDLPYFRHLGWLPQERFIYRRAFGEVFVADATPGAFEDPRALEIPDGGFVPSFLLVPSTHALGPEGQLLVASRRGEREVWAVDPAGGPPLRITHPDGQAETPIGWSPDGQWIVHVGPVGPSLAIKASRADGSTRVPLVLAHDPENDLGWVGWIQ